MEEPIRVAGASGRLLVVDDDAALRRFLGAALGGEGYAVATAPDGRAALDLTARYRPDLILLDLSMPVMDGREFAAAYRRTPPPHAPILVLTGQLDARRAAETAEALEARGFLLKPVDPDSLVEVVRRHVPPARPVRSMRSMRSMRPVGPMHLWTRGRRGEGEAGDELHERRQRDLRRVGAAVTKLREELAAVQEESRALAALELTRRLTREEARRARELTLESERLRLELAGLRDEFERARGG